MLQSKVSSYYMLVGNHGAQVKKLFLIVVCFNCINILLRNIWSKTKPVFSPPPAPKFSYTIRICSTCSCHSFFLNLSPLTARDATKNSTLTCWIQVSDILDSTWDIISDIWLTFIELFSNFYTTKHHFKIILQSEVGALTASHSVCYWHNINLFDLTSEWLTVPMQET